MRSRGPAWHLCMKKSRLWQGAGVFLLLSLQICGSSRCCGLSGQCIFTAMTQSPFPVSGCDVSLLVNVLRKKPQRHLVNIKTKLLGFTPRLQPLLETPLSISLWFLKVAQQMFNYISTTSVCEVKTPAYKLVWQQ